MNLQNTMTDGKPREAGNLPQLSGIPRDPQTLLAEWDIIWSAYMRSQIPYRSVTSWCAKLSEANQEDLWEALQERRRRQFEETAWG